MKDLCMNVYKLQESNSENITADDLCVLKLITVSMLFEYFNVHM